MRILVRGTLLLSTCVLVFTSCQKEISTENGNGGGNGGGGTNGSCNSTVMKLKRVQSTFDEQHKELTWNTDGTIHSIKIHEQFTEDLTATYIYAGGKITQAVLTDNSDGSVVDTAVFRYDAQGHVDSVYKKDNDGFGIKLTYSNGKWVKYTRYDGPGQILYYWTTETDANGNLVKAEEFQPNGTPYGYDKATTYTYTRDDRKNPLAGLAPYLMYMAAEELIFWNWGPNNYTNQRYIDYTGTGTDLTTGYKYKYNNNCYPGSSQMTIAGQTVFTDDDFTYSYY